MENQNNAFGIPTAPVSTPPVIKPSKHHFKYKVLFVASILFGAFILYGLIGNINTFMESFQRGSATTTDLSGLLFLISLLLSFISLPLITYSYIKNRTQTSRLSDICVLTMIVIFILILASIVSVYALLIASGGLLLLIPGIDSIIPFQAIHQAEEIIMGIYFIAFVGLAISFTREHKANKIKISLLWLTVFVVALSWLVPQFMGGAAENSKPLIPPMTITLTGSTAGWLTYNNPQIGLSFMYPPSWPTPSADSGANPRIDIPNPNKNPNQELLSVIIGQTGSDGRTCDDCVAVPLDDAIQSYGPYVGGFSPNYKISQINLDGETYTLFSNTLSAGWTASTTIFIPNEIAPNNYAMVSGGGSVDLNTLYLIVSSFHFFAVTTTTNVQSPASTSAQVPAVSTSSLAISNFEANGNTKNCSYTIESGAGGSEAPCKYLLNNKSITFEFQNNSTGVLFFPAPTTASVSLNGSNAISTVCPELKISSINGSPNFSAAIFNGQKFIVSFSCQQAIPSSLGKITIGSQLNGDMRGFSGASIVVNF